jgi:hypothetical protein
MSTQAGLAKRRLFGDDSLQVKNFKAFPGTGRDVTAQQFADEVNKVVTQLEEGDYELVEAED